MRIPIDCISVSPAGSETVWRPTRFASTIEDAPFTGFISPRENCPRETDQLANDRPGGLDSSTNQQHWFLRVFLAQLLTRVLLSHTKASATCAPKGFLSFYSNAQLWAVSCLMATVEHVEGAQLLNKEVVTIALVKQQEKVLHSHHFPVQKKAQGFRLSLVFRLNGYISKQLFTFQSVQSHLWMGRRAKEGFRRC